MAIQIDPNTATLNHAFTNGVIDPAGYFEVLNDLAEMVKAVRDNDGKRLQFWASMAVDDIEALLDDEDVIATFPHGAELLVAPV